MDRTCHERGAWKTSANTIHTEEKHLRPCEMTIGTLEQQVKIRRRFLTIDQISVPISNVTFYNLAGTYLNIIKRTVKFLCPADVIPPYIYILMWIWVSWDVGQKIVMGYLNVHPTLKLLHSKDEPICKIMGGEIAEQKKSKSLCWHHYAFSANMFTC